MIKYYRLFILLDRKGMKKTDLLKVISSGSLAKLSKGENLQTEIIDKICCFLECQPGDIMEYIIDEKKIKIKMPNKKKDNETIIEKPVYDIVTDESEIIIKKDTQY